MITLKKKKNKRGDYWGVCGWAGNVDLLKGIEEKVLENTGVQLTYYDCKNSQDNIKQIRAKNLEDTIKVLDWLYSGKKYCLKRKYRRYLKLKDRTKGVLAQSDQ